MEVIVGRLAGFCPGITNAVEGAERLLERKKEVYCIGALAHNRQVVNELRKKGMIVKNEVEEIPKGADVIFRAHGVTKDSYKKVLKRRLNLYDYTCRKVMRLHDKVSSKAIDGKYIFLLGDKRHPEIIGTKSFTRENNISIIGDIADITNAFNDFDKSYRNEIFILAQTTFSTKKFEEITSKIKEEVQNRYDGRVDIEIYNSICDSVEKRQREAAEIAKKVDYMIVIGGKHSNNTKELYKTVKENCKNAIHIETKDELKEIDFSSYNKVGVTAGASTPKASIDEVIDLLKKFK